MPFAMCEFAMSDFCYLFLTEPDSSQKLPVAIPETPEIPGHCSLGITIIQ